MTFWISSLALLFLILGCVSIFYLSWNTNNNFTEMLLQSSVRSYIDDLKSSEYRNLIESLHIKYPNFYVEIKGPLKNRFEFNKRSFLSTCHTAKINETNNTPINITLCKPLDLPLNLFSPILVFFILTSSIMILISFKIDSFSKNSLLNMIKDTGIRIKKDANFHDLLSHINLVKNEFIYLKSDAIKEMDKKSKNKVSAHVAHDLRSPLLVFEEILTIETSKDLNEIKPEIEKALSRVNSLINSLNDKSERTLNLIKVSELNFDSVFHEISVLSKKNRVVFSKSLSIKNHRPFLLDKPKYDRVLSNLLSNAIFYCKEIVSCELKTNESHLILKITDDGPGIPKEFEDYIFKENFTFGNLHGTGLGLSFSRNIIHAHGGILRYYRKASQTVFEAIIPMFEFEKKNMVNHSQKIEKPSKVLLILKNKNLFESLKEEALNRGWDLKMSAPDIKEYRRYHLVYSDIPKVIIEVSQSSSRAIVSMSSDSKETVIKKIVEALGHT